MTVEASDLGRSLTRLLRADDVEELTALVVRNKQFMALWEPLRTEQHYTVEGQRVRVERVLAEHENRVALPHVVLDDDGRIIGAITLMGIERGPAQSARVGYWIGQDHNGKGVATRALGHMKGVAFEELHLHRLQAETLAHNVGSQRVLARSCDDAVMHQ